MSMHISRHGYFCSPLRTWSSSCAYITVNSSVFPFHSASAKRVPALASTASLMVQYMVHASTPVICGGYLLFVDLGQDPSCHVSLQLFPFTSRIPSLGGHSLAVAEELVLLLAGLDGRAAELGDEDAVTDGDAHGQSVALLVKGAGADGEDLGLVELLNAGLGEEDAAGGLGLGLDALDEDTVQEGSEGSDGLDGGGLQQSMLVSVRPSEYSISSNWLIHDSIHCPSTLSPTIQLPCMDG